MAVLETNARQTARVVAVSTKGDDGSSVGEKNIMKTHITFEFLCHHEFLKIGTSFVFHTDALQSWGVGVIVALQLYTGHTKEENS